MAWLAERGLISCWADYEALPFHVLDDARMLMEAEANRRARLDKQAEDAARRRR